MYLYLMWFTCKLYKFCHRFCLKFARVCVCLYQVFCHVNSTIFDDCWSSIFHWEFAWMAFFSRQKLLFSKCPRNKKYCKLPKKRIKKLFLKSFLLTVSAGDDNWAFSLFIFFHLCRRFQNHFRTWRSLKSSLLANSGIFFVLQLASNSNWNSFSISCTWYVENFAPGGLPLRLDFSEFESRNIWLFSTFIYCKKF